MLYKRLWLVVDAISVLKILKGRQSTTACLVGSEGITWNIHTHRCNEPRQHMPKLV